MGKIENGRGIIGQTQEGCCNFQGSSQVGMGGSEESPKKTKARKILNLIEDLPPTSNPRKKTKKELESAWVKYSSMSPDDFE